jgi:hypothetical protein
MAIDKTVLETDLEAVIDDDPHVLVIAGNADEIDCSKSKITKEQQYTEYGFGEDYKISVTMVKSDVDTIPEKGVNVTLDDVAYQVLDSETDSMDVGLTLHLGTAIT